MTDKMDVQVRSAQQYFDEFGQEKIYKQKMDRLLVKKQLIDAFHKEIFGIVAARAKKRFDEIPKEGDPEALRIARNVIKDTTKKWIKVVNMFEMYRETSGLLKYDDISLIPEEGNGEIGFADGELVARMDKEAESEDLGTDDDGTPEDVDIQEDIPDEDEAAYEGGEEV